MAVIFQYQFGAGVHQMHDEIGALVVLAGVRFQNTNIGDPTITLISGNLVNNGHIGSVEVVGGDSYVYNTGIVEGTIHHVVQSQEYTSEFGVYNVGTITAAGNSATIDAQLSATSAASVANHGLIVGNINIASLAGSDFGPEFAAFTNTGRILGDVFVRTQKELDSNFPEELGTFSYNAYNSGLITGLVSFSGNLGVAGMDGNTRFVNAGALTDDLLLGRGHDVYRTVGNGYIAGVVDGYDGQDRLIGGTSTDYFLGGEGKDTLAGRQDDDTLVGGTGADWLYGGIGEDVFKYSAEADSNNTEGVDTIFDFNRDQDVIDLRELSEGRLKYIDDDRFSGRGDAEVRCVIDKRRVMHVYADLDGDGAQDFHVVLRRQTAILNDDDFLL